MMVESGSETWESGSEASGEFCVGERVQVLHEGDWYPGEVTSVLESGAWEVQCDDDDEGCITTIAFRDGDRLRALDEEWDKSDRQEWLRNDLDDVERQYVEINFDVDGDVDDGYPVIEVEINFDSDWESESDDDGFSFEVEVWVEDGWSDQEDAPIEQPSTPRYDEPEHMFEDDEFPACGQSVGYPKGDTASGITADKVEGWSRLPELTQEVKLFGLIESNDVKQGAIGNCWFMASCASVATYPEWIRQMFSKNPNITADGKYDVRMYHPGRKTFVYITVSDEVPLNCNKDPMCAKLTDENEMWVCLIEKAFAKMCASYSATESGAPCWGMVYLCGGEGEMWDRNDDSSWSRYVVTWKGGDGDQVDRKGEKNSGDGTPYSKKKVWMAMTKYCDKNYPMCCSCGGDKGVNNLGIMVGHAYSLIAVREVRIQGKVIKLLKIRNPHGEKEFQGDWSDNSRKWNQHPAVRDELMFEQREDGFFWMSFKDFCSIFTTFSVCKRAMPLEGVHEDKINQMKARGLY